MTDEPVGSRPGSRIFTRDFALVWGAALGLYLGHQSIIPTLPVFVRAAGADATVVGLVSGSYLVSSALSAFVSPWIVATLRARRLVLLVMPVMAVGTAGYLVAPTIVGLAGLTIVRGAAFGFANTALVLVVVDTVPPDRRATGIGVYQFAVSLASVFGMTTGLWLIDTLGFSPIAVVASSVLAVGTLALASVHHDGHAEGHERVRLAAAVREPGVGPPALTFLGLTVVYGAVVTFTAVLLNETGVGNPVVFFGLTMLAQVVARPLSGRLSDRFSPATVATLGFVSAAVGVATLAGVPTHAAYLAGILFGFGFGTGVVAIQVILMANESAAVRSAASSVFSVAYAGGMGLGALLFGPVIEAWGFRWAYAGMALVLAPAVMALVRRSRRRVVAAPDMAST